MAKDSYCCSLGFGCFLYSNICNWVLCGPGWEFIIMKVAITLSVDSEIKAKAMKIIQQKLGSSVSAYVNDRLRELVESNIKSIKLSKEVKQNANNKRLSNSL